MQVQKHSRRQRVLAFLTQQLKDNTKTEKKTLNTKIPLTEGDTKRIKKEIETLKN